MPELNEDHFWREPEGWHYSRKGIEVGPFDTFDDAVADYYEPDAP